MTTERDQAEKALAEAKGEHDRIVADTARPRRVDALQQQLAAFNEQFAGRKTNRPRSRSK